MLQPAAWCTQHPIGLIVTTISSVLLKPPSCRPGICLYQLLLMEKYLMSETFGYSRVKADYTVQLLNLFMSL
jgi:hypothetical protein